MNSIIFVIDDDKIVLEMIKRMLDSRTDCDVFTFHNPRDIFEHEKFNVVDLFIIDISLGKEDGRCIYKEAVKKGIHPPCLFISGSIMDVTFEGLDNLDDLCIFDFTRKPIISVKKFLNRICLLLKFSKQQTCLEEKIEHKDEAVWDMMNYSTFYVVITNDKLDVIKANYALAISLGFENEEDIIGVNWLTFIKESTQPVIENVHDNIKRNTGKFTEFTNELKTLNGEIVVVKWFNSYLNHNLNYTFSIGIPLTKNITPEASIDSIRSYYRDILDKDKSMIESMKEMVIKNGTFNK